MTCRQTWAESCLVIRVWCVYKDELREIVLSECGQEAVFEDIVVVDDDTHIYGVIRACLVRYVHVREPLRTSLISPGGDCRTKALATWMRSSESVMVFERERD